MGFTAAARGGLVIDPLYIRPEDIREVAYLPGAQRTMLDWGSETIRATNTEADSIDFAQVWEAKRAALEVIYAGKRSLMREVSFQRFVKDHGHALAEYVHAAVAEEAGAGGTDEGQRLFTDLCSDSTTGAAARREHHDRIYFYLWLQWVAREQLARAHQVARETGMRLGLVHTAPAAADPEILGEIHPYAGGVFLTDIGGGDAQEAVKHARAAGVVLFADGRDLATREQLVSLGIIPQTTLWAEFDGEAPRDLQHLPRESMLAVTTTQNPPTAGFLAEEHLSLMNRLGLLNEPYESVRKTERIMRERLMARVRERSLLPEGATERQLIEGLHQYLAFSPAQFLTLTLSDAVGNRRPFTLGGDYPDWTYPYTDGAGAGVLVDEINENARFNSLLSAVDSQLRGE